MVAAVNSLPNGVNKNGPKITRNAASLQIVKKIKILSTEIQKETSSEAYDRLRLEIDEILEELEQDRILNRNEIEKLYTVNTLDKMKTNKGAGLPDKIFTPRNSLLTDLWENKHIGTIYHIFLAMLFGLFVNTAASNYIHKGNTKLGLELTQKSFSNIHRLVFVWICMFLTTFLVYFGVRVWARIRSKTSYYNKWDKFCCAVYILYVLCFGYLSIKMVVRHKLTTAEAVAALCEMTRFLMKSHAFVRSNVPALIKRNQKKEFSKFVYFLFAPTLIYQDAYPRSKSIRWRYVMVCFAEVFGCILYISFVFERFLVPDFEHFGLREYSWKTIVLIILGNGVSGTLMLLCTFYAIMHSWHNGFAELLRFADRMFYKDWWTSTSFGRFYSTWNVIVHDWLYTYLYKDFYEIIVPNNKVFAKFMVFLISATFHEIILGFGFGFFFPILFVLFFILGFAVSFVRTKYELIGNFGMWYGLSLGMGIAMSTYCMEFFARMNCASEYSGVATYFVPMSLFVCM